MGLWDLPWRQDARTASPRKLAVMKEYGVTRISINPQTMNDETLPGQSGCAQCSSGEEAFAMARQAGFDINMDLIAGLPGRLTRDETYVRRNPGIGTGEPDSTFPGNQACSESEPADG